MKRLAGFAALVLSLSLLPAARAQENPDDQYLVIYALMQQADTFNNSGDPRRALADYIEAQTDLEKFHRVFPDWYPKIVSFRMSYLADKIAEATAELPVTNTPPPVASVPATPATAAEAAKAQLESQLSALHDQLKQLQTDNETLQAKLKEALAVQPAAVSPREFAQVQEQLRSLMKENDLLKVNLAQGQGGPAAGVDAKAFDLLKLALAEANQKLADQTARADKLTLENQTLQTRLQSLLAGADAAEALRQENELLKQQVASLKSVPPAATGTNNANAELARARVKIASLQSAAEVGWLEKMALENRVKQLQGLAVSPMPGPAPAATGPSQAENEARIHELEQERDELMARLGDANQRLYGSKNQDAAAQIDALAREVDTLRARIAVDEAQPVPYTPEELALFKPSAPALAANPNAEEKSIRELPGGVASLAAEAQNYFSARDYGKAEADYQEILRHDQNNGLALANLAEIELEENKLDNADKHIQAALARSPNDAYNLTVLGRIRFSEARYDEALDALSRAAKLNPQSPDIENYLGVTLAEKGLRGQAETALRRAVQLDPHYAAAHNNLAVIYLTQQPPMVELARWHYEKALANGQPRNPTLEKLLAEKGAPVNP